MGCSTCSTCLCLHDWRWGPNCLQVVNFHPQISHSVIYTLELLYFATFFNRLPGSQISFLRLYPLSVGSEILCDHILFVDWKWWLIHTGVGECLKMHRHRWQIYKFCNSDPISRYFVYFCFKGGWYWNCIQNTWKSWFFYLYRSI